MFIQFNFVKMGCFAGKQCQERVDSNGVYAWLSPCIPRRKPSDLHMVDRRVIKNGWA